jgi:hypothetical protein
MKEFDLGDVQLEASNLSVESTTRFLGASPSKENCSYVRPEEETF